MQDFSEALSPVVFTESFSVREDISDAEAALRLAVKEFTISGSEEAIKAVQYAAGCFNWGDALISIPNDWFSKYGLLRLDIEATDMIVDHDEIIGEELTNDTTIN